MPRFGTDEWIKLNWSKLNGEMSQMSSIVFLYYWKIIFGSFWASSFRV